MDWEKNKSKIMAMTGAVLVALGSYLQGDQSLYELAWTIVKAVAGFAP